MLTLLTAVDQAFFMGMCFLVAGYFTPGSWRKKGTVRFVRERLVRLGIPLLAFGFVRGPQTRKRHSLSLSRSPEAAGRRVARRDSLEASHQRAHICRRHTGRLRRGAGFETVWAQHVGSLACKPLAGRGGMALASTPFESPPHMLARSDSVRRFSARFISSKPSRVASSSESLASPTRSPEKASP